MAVSSFTGLETGPQSVAKLNAIIGELEAMISDTELAAEVTARKAGDQANIDALTAEKITRNTAITQEANTRKIAIATEMTARVAAIQQLSTLLSQGLSSMMNSLAQETTARIADDLIRARVDHVLNASIRPGDAPSFFTLASTPAGPDSGLPEVASDRISTGPNGRVVVMNGRSMLTARSVTRVEPARQYKARYVVQRIADSADPANDGVELGIVFLDGNLSIIGEHVGFRIVDLETGNGRLEYAFNFARDDASNIDRVIDPAVVYVRPFIRSHGYQESGITHAEVISVDDMSDAVDFSPDVSMFLRKLAGWEYLLGIHSTHLAQALEDLAASRDAGWFTQGTLHDNRLSARVVFRDVASQIGGSLTFTDVLRLRNDLYIGDGAAPDAGAVARMTRHDNRVAIEPTNMIGQFRTDRALQYDPDVGVWAALGGFATNGNMAVTGSISVGDAPTTRNNLDVYSRAEVNDRFEVLDAVVRKGGIDCSTNPDYPAANAGHVYVVTAGGKIGGVAGVDVETGDALLCNADGSGPGPHAAVGANWTILQFNVVNPLTAAHIGATVQAYDADLAAIAALATTAYGRAFLTLADAAAARTAIDAQQADTDLAAIAALATTAYGRNLLTLADAPAARTNFDVYSKSEVDNRFEVLDAVVRKGGIDCSTNPDYPAANAGHVYVITVAGKIGGAAGLDVETGDAVMCNVDGTAAGSQAAVGTNWTVLQFNVVNPLTATHIGATVQAYNANLTAIAALTPANDDILQRKGGAWVNRTVAQVTADIRAARDWMHLVAAPATAASTGAAGQVAYDADYFYVCTATDTWRRVAHATW